MSERPKRRRPGPKWRRRSASDAPQIPGDLDLRTLVVLSVGEWWELGDHEWPPSQICRWLEKADRRQLRGILLATLERWQEARQQ